MQAKIYQPTKNAMQSGKANTQKWILEFLPETEKTIDPIMGWTGSTDTQTQLKMKFKSCEEAVEYAKNHKIEYLIIEPKKPKLIKQTYADNFTRVDVYNQN